MTEETDKQFVERMMAGAPVVQNLNVARLYALALRGAETQDEDGTPKTMQQNGMKIAAEQIPFPVQKALRKTLLDGETDERRAIAAALNAWPNAFSSPVGGIGAHERIVLPLPQKEPRT